MRGLILIHVLVIAAVSVALVWYFNDAEMTLYVVVVLGIMALIIFSGALTAYFYFKRG